MRWSFTFCALLIVALGCTPAPRQDSAGAIDPTAAATYFEEFDELCRSDGGELWGVSLCGPILLVDPATRAVAGDRADWDEPEGRRSSGAPELSNGESVDLW